MSGRHIEVVCTGNICRSPIGEVVLRAKLAEAGLDDVVVTSSGTGGWHSGDPMDPRAAAALARNGYDGSAHRAREFRSYWFGERDLVLAMDSSHLSTLVRRSGGAVAVPIELFAVGDVPDPYYGDDADFDEVVSQIEKAADLWISRLRQPLASGLADLLEQGGEPADRGVERLAAGDPGELDRP